MELVVTENVTLDGVIDAVDDWFQPAGNDEMRDTSDIEEAVREQMQAQDALLLGRVTFESFRGYWPLQTEDTTGITAHLNAVGKYVISDTLSEPGWENTTLLRGPLEADVRKLKSLPGHELGVTGSISVVTRVIAAGLVDTYRLFVYPLVLGGGARLFASGLRLTSLRLMEVKHFRSGVVLMSHQTREA